MGLPAPEAPRGQVIADHGDHHGGDGLGHGGRGLGPGIHQRGAARRAGLESELGTSLLERTTRARRITDAGQRFYGRARDILAAYDEAAGELQQRSSALSGRLRFSQPRVKAFLDYLAE
ncbi:MAG: hypothetical protein KC457_34295 [Myxococcales bacterium]|nr:hypothetical protein [Myxococcales bacterium]